MAYKVFPGVMTSPLTSTEALGAIVSFQIENPDGHSKLTVVA